MKKGLILNPLHAQTTGRSLGDGVYFADVFDKSIAYSDHESGRSRYILLCDVDLGEYRRCENYYGWSEDVGGSGKEDSLWALGNHGPDPTKVKRTFKLYSKNLRGLSQLFVFCNRRLEKYYNLYKKNLIIIYVFLINRFCHQTKPIPKLLLHLKYFLKVYKYMYCNSEGA